MDAKLEMTRQWIMRADDDLRLVELIQKFKPSIIYKFLINTPLSTAINHSQR